MAAPSAEHEDRVSLENEKFVHEARHYFISKYEEYTRKPYDGTDSAVARLHAELARTVAAISEGLDAWQKSDELNERLAREYGHAGGVNAFIDNHKRLLKENQEQSRRTEEERDRWLEHADALPLWWTLLSFLPPVRRRIALRNRRYLDSRKLQVDADPADVPAVTARLDDRIAELRSEGQRLSASLRDAEDLKKLRDGVYGEWREWSRTHGIDGEPPALLEEVDRKLRHKAFKLATHYWEARWLIEMRAQLDERFEDKRSEKKLRMRWRRYAKLAPCNVSTLHMLPEFFLAFESRAGTEEWRDVPLLEYIDLLIIDEAGQVPPDVAGAAFALAKRALVVGDTRQIEPVWNVTRPVDYGNMRRGGVISALEEETSLHEAGLSASRGRVMTIAQRASKYQKSDERGKFERGMFLAEHRRCMDGIIAYCNDLAYSGRLVPMCDRVHHGELPLMGYRHIPGSSKPSGTSRTNSEEAEVIARWIADRRRFLEGLYLEKKSIDEIVAVATPFNRQAVLLRRELKRLGLGGVTAGTVHVLQGSERPVIIFSSVYGDGEVGLMMFDRSVNMLNVAVSRAMDSFLVFGNVEALARQPASSPSGLLARYIFAAESNRLPDA